MRHFLHIFLWLLPFCALAQPVNDECGTAIELTNLENWCSAVAAFNNNTATTSGNSLPRCQAQGTSPRDIWFRFTAIGTALNVRVIGDLDREPGGSLSNPEVSVYQGSCSQLAEVGCLSDAFNAGIVELLLHELTVGRTYYLRISGRSNSTGTFQLCLQSFNDVPDASSDCRSGVVLCDKSAFVVESLSGVGSDRDEARGSCLGTNGASESSSAWYKWVAGTSGTLTFTLTPSNPTDDLDFAVYELPNGLNDCGNKRLLRCMASGETVGCPLSAWVQCTGPTGLNLSSTDQTETQGCMGTTDPCLIPGPNDDNFVSAIQMEAGKAYALIVNNYSQSGSGFSIEFGGSAEFLGPKADFLTDDLDGTVCFGDPVVFFDRSTFGNLRILEWLWNFGEGAVPQQLTGPGPHRIRYDTPGPKSISLTVQSETGCLITAIGSLIVEAPFQILADILPQTCPESQDGKISLDVVSGSTITSIQWNNGQLGPNIDSLLPGEYTAILANANGCDTMVSLIVEAPQPLEIQEIITMPSCGGGADGSILLTVNGQAPPFLYDFNQGSGFQITNQWSNLQAGIYTIDIQDNNGCLTQVQVPLGEINVVVDPDFDPVTPPTCFGFSNGRIELRISGGVSPFTYDWELDGIYENSNVLTGVPAGSFFVSVRDGGGCQGFVSLVVPQPDELLVFLDTVDISCFGEKDGSLRPTVTGGTKSYLFNWSNGLTDSVAVDLESGIFSVTVEDANGCVEDASGFISEPPAITLRVDSIRNVVCFGDRTGAVFLTGSGGSPSFVFSVDGGVFQDSSIFESLPAGNHLITVRDSRGCFLMQEVEVTQPEPLLVHAGPDTVVDLGFSIRLLATHEPVGKPVIYTWSPSESLDCVDCPFPISSPNQSTNYLITIEDEAGCQARDEVFVLVALNRPVFIPSSFTPNGDGFNDRLTVFGGPGSRLVKSLRIFDRWGEMVFEGRDLELNNENHGWDGFYRNQPLNPGVFVYVAEVEFIDNSILQFEGDITLIR